jgi:hypothetical protein
MHFPSFEVKEIKFYLPPNIILFNFGKETIDFRFGISICLVSIIKRLFASQIFTVPFISHEIMYPELGGMHIPSIGAS